MAGETGVEAARIAWDGHQAEHSCTTLTCATAQLRYQLYLAAIREEQQGSREDGKP
jgi:hypothetical protein